MKHYIMVGVLALSLFFATQYARGELWFQDREVHVVATTAPAAPWSWHGSVEPGATVRVVGVNGPIEAHRADGDEVEVEALRKGRNAAERIRIAVVEHSGGVTVCALYPTRRAEPSCTAEGPTQQSVRAANLSVTFRVGVPDGVAFIARTVNGAVTAEGLAGNVEAKSVNGSITIGTDGRAEASTVNGAIRASVGVVDDFGELAFRTTNGSITLTLPENVDAEFDGGTTSGSIRSDFPLEVTGRYGPKRLSGVLGSGGDHILLRSVNGSIRILHR